MNCDELSECKLAEIQKELVELRRDVARYENSRLILNNMIKARDAKIRELEGTINLLKTERSIRGELL